MRPTWRRLIGGLLYLSAFPLMGGARTACADGPAGWGGGGQGYELFRDDAVKHGGKSSGSVRSLDDATNGFGTLTQAFRADRYRGKRLRMSGHAKSEGVEGWAGLWMRVDGKDKTGLAFDNMQTRAVKGSTDWRRHEVVLDVPAEAEEIYFGFLVAGKGQAWVDDLTFEVVGNDVPPTGVATGPMDRVGELVKDLPEEPRNVDFEK